MYTRVRKRADGPVPDGDQVANVPDLSSTDTRL